MTEYEIHIATHPEDVASSEARKETSSRRKGPDISVVVPVYNSALTLEPLFKRIRKTLNKLEVSFEVIFVEDGGKDNSWQKLIQLKRANPEEITIIKLARNFGQNSATWCGLNYAKGSLVVTIDDDLQIPPEEIAKLIDKYKETQPDVVYGVYPKKKHSIFRNLGSSMIKALFKYLVGSSRIGSSFRLISGKMVEMIKAHTQDLLFIDQVISWHTIDIEFLEVEHEKRKFGRSGYSTFRLIQMALKLIIHYTDLPLKLMTYTGILSSIASFLVGLFYIYQKLVYGAELGFTSLIVAIFFGTSIILFSLGIVGEYISRIYVSRINKPPYSVKVKF